MNLTNPTSTTTTPETDTETPPTKVTDVHHHHPSKLLTFTNGALKHHQSAAAPSVVIYKECLKNHAASLGGHALDGCGEFMPSPTATASDPTSLKCAACGCHRNFHRREPEDGTHIVEYLPHPHQVLPPRGRSPSSASPPPISSTYYPSAPHMLLALSTGKHETNPSVNANATAATTTTTPISGNPNGGRKRFRTKFSQEQKEKMLSFSERLGWKMQKRDEGLVEEFCNDVGVGKGVLKVWMHNNKHTYAKRDVNSSSSDQQQQHLHLHLHSDNANSINTSITTTTTAHNHHNHDTSAHVVNNGSSSSS